MSFLRKHSTSIALMFTAVLYMLCCFNAHSQDKLVRPVVVTLNPKNIQQTAKAPNTKTTNKTKIVKIKTTAQINTLKQTKKTNTKKSIKKTSKKTHSKKSTAKVDSNNIAITSKEPIDSIAQNIAVDTALLIEPNLISVPDSTATLPEPEEIVPEIITPSDEIAEADSTLSYKLGDILVILPDCIESNNSAPDDFFLASFKDVLDIDAWSLNDSYKISTPEAYTNYIKRRMTIQESFSQPNGIRVLKGVNPADKRQFYVAMYSCNQKFYVVRLLFDSSIAEALNEYVFPNLISLSSDTTQVDNH